MKKMKTVDSRRLPHKLLVDGFSYLIDNRVTKLFYDKLKPTTARLFNAALVSWRKLKMDGKELPKYIRVYASHEEDVAASLSLYATPLKNKLQGNECDLVAVYELKKVLGHVQTTVITKFKINPISKRKKSAKTK